MNRCLALILACFFALMMVSSACTAEPSNWIRFTLEPTGGNDRIRARFRDESASNHSNSWSSSLAGSELVGLGGSGFRAAGVHPLRFALVREAGRLDCSEPGGD
jgi:hypothetical protein